MQKNQSKPQPPKNRFVNYEQRQWDFDEMERLEWQLLQEEAKAIREKENQENNTVNG